MSEHAYLRNYEGILSASPPIIFFTFKQSWKKHFLSTSRKQSIHALLSEAARLSENAAQYWTCRQRKICVEPSIPRRPQITTCVSTFSRASRRALLANISPDLFNDAFGPNYAYCSRRHSSSIPDTPPQNAFKTHLASLGSRFAPIETRRHCYLYKII